jgi:SAM-dependent methyltransferase
MHVFFSLKEMPVICNNLWSTREQALNCKRGDIILGFCSNCGFIKNLAYKPSESSYTEEYENSLHFSDRFQQYAEALTNRLIEKYDLRGKNIIEIGCGKGDFLLMLCKKGKNRGLGFDKSYVDLPGHSLLGADVAFEKDQYSEKYESFKADMIICRHVLEHIDDPLEFILRLRNIVKNRKGLLTYFEVPNSLLTFNNLAIWDIIYEHPGYFTSPSLRQVFQNAGFSVLEEREEYEGQFLSLIATLSDNSNQHHFKNQNEINSLRDNISSFQERYSDYYQTLGQVLKDVKEEGKKAVIWGTGSKGVTFLNLYKNHGLIDYAVDLNPRKHGKFVSGSAQEIVAPEFLKQYQPGVIFIMNPIYESEIRLIIADLGISPDLIICYGHNPQ